MCRISVKRRTGNRSRNLSVGSLCLGSVCIGLTLGWPESSLVYLLLANWDTTVYGYPLRENRETIPMIMNFASCIGALVPSCIADRYGRRFSFAISGVTNFIFWTILVYSRGYTAIILSAVIGGFAAGVFIATTALYISEISLPQTRVAIGALSALSAYSGVLFGSCLIFMTFIRTVALIMACLAISFVATLHWWMIESPYFLFLRGKTLETKLTLKSLRGAATVLDIDCEYRAIEFFHSNERVKNAMLDKRKRCRIFGTISRGRIYGICVIIFLCITQMTGSYGIDDYSRAFVEILLPNYGGIVVSTIDVISVGIYIILIDKFRRKSLLLKISVLGSSLSCLIIAIIKIVEHVTNNHLDDEKTTISAAVILSLYYIIYSLGLIPLLPIATSDLFLSRHRTKGFCISISFIYLSSFVISIIFDTLIQKLGSNLAFVTFALFSCLGVPFVFAIPSKTYDKMIYDIQPEDVTIITS